LNEPTATVSRSATPCGTRAKAALLAVAGTLTVMGALRAVLPATGRTCFSIAPQMAKDSHRR
jgi:hypothetical protein